MVLVLLLGGGVGAVGCRCCWLCCQVSVALILFFGGVVCAVGFWWPWFCRFVESFLVLPVALVLSVDCSWHWCCRL